MTKYLFLRNSKVSREMAKESIGFVGSIHTLKSWTDNKDLSDKICKILKFKNPKNKYKRKRNE